MDCYQQFLQSIQASSKRNSTDEIGLKVSKTTCIREYTRIEYASTKNAITNPHNLALVTNVADCFGSHTTPELQAPDVLLINSPNILNKKKYKLFFSLLNTNHLCHNHTL